MSKPTQGEACFASLLARFHSAVDEGREDDAAALGKEMAAMVNKCKFTLHQDGEEKKRLEEQKAAKLKKIMGIKQDLVKVAEVVNKFSEEANKKDLRTYYYDKFSARRMKAKGFVHDLVGLQDKLDAIIDVDQDLRQERKATNKLIQSGFDFLTPIIQNLEDSMQLLNPEKHELMTKRQNEYKLQQEEVYSRKKVKY
eukprot:Phypoly_transcript_06913.p1 GENE.Phypoly_transcript_06913~~Phypoly_transcript_06913.p1  ORF type:complete len:197 (+),score=42.69 Phypoly_transcript_06913:142-732(+)